MYSAKMETDNRGTMDSIETLMSEKIYETKKTYFVVAGGGGSSWHVEHKQRRVHDKSDKRKRKAQHTKQCMQVIRATRTMSTANKQKNGLAAY